jgi:hypothetical protein
VCVFISCGEEDPAEGISVEGTFTSKATIEGYAYLSTNKSSTEVVEYAPEGTLLSFTIAYSDLGVQVSNGKYVKTTTVDANGYYSIELPARADGASVSVNISGAQVLLTITTDEGNSKEQVFEITSGTTQTIAKDLTYLKKLEYKEIEVLQESENWEEGTYQVTLKYYNGKEEIFVPKDTEVKITISKDYFVPKRANDLILVKKVGDNGLLEIKSGAPSLLSGGLPFSLKSVFIADYITDVVKNIAVAYSYELSSSATGAIYGGETIFGGTILYQPKNKVGDEPDPKKSWTDGTYIVRLACATGAYDENLNPILRNVPSGIALEVEVYNVNSNPLAVDYKFATTVKNGGIVTFDLKAPPATESKLNFKIKGISFIMEANDGNDYLFNIPPVSGYIYGGRTVDGGTIEATRGSQLPS